MVPDSINALAPSTRVEGVGGKEGGGRREVGLRSSYAEKQTVGAKAQCHVSGKIAPQAFHLHINCTEALERLP